MNELWEIFEQVIKDHADDHCPIKEIRVRNDSPHWFSRELLEEIYHRDRLYKKAKFSKLESDWIIFKEKRKCYYMLRRSTSKASLRKRSRTLNGFGVV